MQLIHSLQQDWLTFKTVVQAQYEEKIEEQTSNLCKYINDRLRDIEFFHKRKEAQIRQSYQQQLCDALAVLRSNIEKYYSINEEDTESSSAEFLRLLRSKLHEEQSRIEDLERKLNEYQERGKDKMVAFEDDDHEKKMLEKENEVFKEEIFELHNKIFHLENSLKRSEKENSLLDKQVQRMQLKLETDERTIQKVNLSSMTQFPILKIVISIYLWRSIGKLIAIQGQMKAEIENERSLVKSLTSGLQVEEEEVKKNKLPVQSETENIVLEEKREFQKDHLTKQKDLTKQELTNKPACH
nr:PREDICTED: intermediate filament protein ifa-1-like [Struthio camelus australis]